MFSGFMSVDVSSTWLLLWQGCKKKEMLERVEGIVLQAWIFLWYRWDKSWFIDELILGRSFELSVKALNDVWILKFEIWC